MSRLAWAAFVVLLPRTSAADDEPPFVEVPIEETLNLERVIDQSPLIVLARGRSPAMVDGKVAVEIEEAEGAPDFEPFVSPIRRFELVRVLRNEKNEPVPKTFEVVSPNLVEDLIAHEAHALDRRDTPLYHPRYKSTAAYLDARQLEGREILLFLRSRTVKRRAPGEIGRRLDRVFGADRFELSEEDTFDLGETHRKVQWILDRQERRR